MLKKYIIMHTRTIFKNMLEILNEKEKQGLDIYKFQEIPQQPIYPYEIFPWMIFQNLLSKFYL